MQASPHLPSLRRLLCAATVSAATGASLFAQAPEIGFLVASDGGTSDQFGAAMVRNGDQLLVGAPFHDTTGTDEGAAYVFGFDGFDWVEQAVLTASDSANFDNLGRILAISGDLAVLGVPNHDAFGANAGAAYVFRFDGNQWVQEQKLIGSDSVAGDLFGSAVAVEGKDIVVGAAGEDGAGSGSGALYAFRYRGSALGWLEEQKFQHSTASSGDALGSVLLLRAGVLLAGVPMDEPAGLVNTGALFLFQRSGTWQEVAELRPSGLASFDGFGSSLALDGDTLMVGVPFDDVNATDSGAVYVYRDAGGTWVEAQQLRREQAATSDRFGFAVDLDGDRALVGVPLADAGAGDSGLALSFRRRHGFWAEDQPLGTSNPLPSDQVGTAVAVRGSLGLASGPLLDPLGSNSGALARHVVGDFVLDIQPAQPSAGDLITSDAYNGFPGQPVILVLREVNGSPVFNVLLNFRFTANHHFTLSATTPAGLGGTSIGFQTFKFGAFDEVQASNIARIDLQ